MLVTSRLYLRSFAHADAEASLAWLADAEVMRYVEPPFDLPKAQQFLADCAHLVFCLCLKGGEIPIGHIIWHPYKGNPKRYELGWILAKGQWGRGYAREISKAILEQAKGQGIEEIILETVPENRASIALIQSLGAEYSYTEEGLLVYRIKL